MRTPAGLRLLATFALAFGCSDPVDPTGTPKHVDVPVGADGADLATLVRTYPAGTSFYLSDGVYRTSSSVTPKPGSSFVGVAEAIASATSLVDWLAAARNGMPR